MGRMAPRPVQPPTPPLSGGTDTIVAGGFHRLGRQSADTVSRVFPRRAGALALARVGRTGGTVNFLEAEDPLAAATGGTTSASTMSTTPGHHWSGPDLGAFYNRCGGGPMSTSSPTAFASFTASSRRAAPATKRGAKKRGSSKQPKTLPKDPSPHLAVTASTGGPEVAPPQAPSVPQLTQHTVEELTTAKSGRPVLCRGFPSQDTASSGRLPRRPSSASAARLAGRTGQVHHTLEKLQSSPPRCGGRNQRPLTLAAPAGSWLRLDARA